MTKFLKETFHDSKITTHFLSSIVFFTGIKEAVEVFKNSFSGPEIQKILVAFTDGPGSISPEEESLLAKQNNITTIAFGIGERVDQNELLIIANNETENAYRFQDFNITQEFVAILNTEISKPCIEEIYFDQEIEGNLYGNDTLYFQTEILSDEGLTVSLKNVDGTVDAFFSYTYETPNRVFNNGSISEGQYFFPFDASIGKHLFIAIEGIGNFCLLLEIGDTIPILITTEVPTMSTTELDNMKEKSRKKNVITVNNELANFEKNENKSYTFIWMIIAGCLLVFGLIGFGCHRLRDRKNRGDYYPQQQMS